MTYQATKLDHEYQVGNEGTTEFMMGACDAANGYAPGEYMIRCHKCGQHKHGMDKRAITCAECAKKTRAAAAAAPPHFDIPYPPAPRPAEEEAVSKMRDALQKAWLALDALQTYRDDAELLALLRSQQMTEARQAVRQATALTVGAPR